MEQKNMEKNQEVLERTAETLEALTFSIFIDRRRFMEDGVPARYVDSFIRYKMNMDPEEFKYIVNMMLMQRIGDEE